MNIRRDDRKMIERTNQERTANEAGRLARNAYAREWRANNREKVKQYNNTYWLKKAAAREAIGG